MSALFAIRSALNPLCANVSSVFQSNGPSSSLPPVYALLANIQIARARKAPKLIIPEPSKRALPAHWRRRVLIRYVQGRTT